MLTLSEAQKSGRLPEFIDQEETRGVGPANQKQFDAAVKRLATPPRSEDRTSRSPARGGSSGKKTR